MTSLEPAGGATDRIVSTLTAMFNSEISGDEDLVDPLLDELTELTRDQIEATCLSALEMIKGLLEMWADVNFQREAGRPATQIEKSQWGLERIREQAEAMASELERPDDR